MKKTFTEMSSEEQQRFREAFLKKFVEDQTPLPGNICKAEGCGGRIVQKVASLFRGRFSFWPPECEKCGRGYRKAKNVPKVGVQEFIRSLHTPIRHHAHR